MEAGGGTLRMYQQHEYLVIIPVSARMPRREYGPLPTLQAAAAALSNEGGVAVEEAGAAAGPGVTLDDSPEALAAANRMMQEAAAKQKTQAAAGERQAPVAEARTHCAAS